MKIAFFILLSWVIVMDSCLNIYDYNVSQYIISDRDEYNDIKLLGLFADILNHSIPGFRDVNQEGFFIDERGRTIGFFIYDLTEPTNTIPPPKGTSHVFRFYSGHIYHFCPLLVDLSISHIAYLENDKLKVFRGINCPEKGDDLSIVLGYLDGKLKNNTIKMEILERVKRYRDYGYYIKIDTDKVYCTEFVK